MPQAKFSLLRLKSVYLEIVDINVDLKDVFSYIYRWPNHQKLEVQMG